ncbi:hypothetical protein [Melghirimyces algeriensis]|uniref:Uncharacterized protein n=1 Tax=Melghirimyces algeriensis TaxID=910412 RepID=A0A521AIL0_9BACL|nr:hypothetical protein [Melghirimyces algeriensis]SMO34617.1 hypothetical protein SAMN06264849_101158 [Melghirimyces algeriensis]
MIKKTGELMDDPVSDQDVVHIYSTRLALGRSAEGTHVFLQEVQLKRPLPPGASEVFLHLCHECLPPVLDVREEMDRLVMVHPPLAGDPLSELVHPGKGMDPYAALTLYRKLLRGAIWMSNLALPLTASLDPLNIMIHGNRPYFILFGFRNFAKLKDDEQWRYLLYFLLTGYRMEERSRMEGGLQHSDLPTSLKELIEQGLEPDMTMESMLDAVEYLLDAYKKGISDFSEEKKRRRRKQELLTLLIVTVTLLGFIWGQQYFHTSESPVSSNNTTTSQSPENRDPNVPLPEK